MSTLPVPVHELVRACGFDLPLELRLACYRRE
jgi:hypothetical protein